MSAQKIVSLILIDFQKTNRAIIARRLWFKV